MSFNPYPFGWVPTPFLRTAKRLVPVWQPETSTHLTKEVITMEQWITPVENQFLSPYEDTPPIGRWEQIPTDGSYFP